MFLVIYTVELALRLFAYGVAKVPVKICGTKDPETALTSSAEPPAQRTLDPHDKALDSHTMGVN